MRCRARPGKRSLRAGTFVFRLLRPCSHSFAGSPRCAGSSLRVNSTTLFVPTMSQFRAWLGWGRGWGVRPALVATVAVAILWLGRPERPRWLAGPSENRISALRTKLIGESQLSRVLFARINTPTEPATAEAAQDAVARARGLRVPALHAELDAECAEIGQFLGFIAAQRAATAGQTPAWAALQCEALTCLGDLNFVAGRDAEARKNYQQALALAVEAQSPLAWCDAAQNLQRTLKLKGRHSEAEPLARRLVELRTTHQGLTARETIACLSELALACEAKGDTAAAEPLFARVLALQDHVLGPGHPDTLTCLSHLAAMVRGRKDFTRAIPLFRRSLQLRAQTLGEEHPDTLKNMNDLAVLIRIESDQASSEALYRRGLEKAAFLDQVHPERTGFVEIAMHGREDGYAEAEALLRRGLGACERRLGKDDAGTLMNLKNLGGLLAAQGRFDEAESFLERGLAGFEKILPRTSPTLMDTMEAVARLREKMGRLSRALPLAEELVERTRETQPAGSPERAALEKWLGELRIRATQPPPKFGAASRAPNFRTDC